MMIFGGALGATAVGPIRAIQTDLVHIGALTRVTGVLDATTVAAVNQVFNGWDDAPEKLRTGRLTAHDVAANLPLVKRYLHAAVTGAMAVAAG